MVATDVASRGIGMIKLRSNPPLPLSPSFAGPFFLSTSPVVEVV